MQPTHQDHRTEHNTTPLVNKLDREARRSRETETPKQANSVEEQMRGRKDRERGDEIKEVEAGKWGEKEEEEEKEEDESYGQTEMKMKKKDNPRKLGLPRGSLRALLTALFEAALDNDGASPVAQRVKKCAIG
ncbi:hypothetical protein ABVT39_007805 [Epinephelus coioides]